MDWIWRDRMWELTNRSALQGHALHNGIIRRPAKHKQLWKIEISFEWNVLQVSFFAYGLSAAYAADRKGHICFFLWQNGCRRSLSIRDTWFWKNTKATFFKIRRTQMRRKSNLWWTRRTSKPGNVSYMQEGFWTQYWEYRWWGSDFTYCSCRALNRHLMGWLQQRISLQLPACVLHE